MKNKIILLFLTWLLGFSIVFIMSKSSAPISAMVYWIILGLFIFTVSLLKIGSETSLLFTLILFIIAGLLTAFKADYVAEIIMRISLLGWLVGIAQAIFEYFFKKK